MFVEPPSTGQLGTDPRLARRHSPFSPVVVSAMGSTEAAASGSTATGIQKNQGSPGPGLPSRFKSFLVVLVMETGQCLVIWTFFQWKLEIGHLFVCLSIAGLMCFFQPQSDNMSDILWSLQWPHEFGAPQKPPGFSGVHPSRRPEVLFFTDSMSAAKIACSCAFRKRPKPSGHLCRLSWQKDFGRLLPKLV